MVLMRVFDEGRWMLENVGGGGDVDVRLHRGNHVACAARFHCLLQEIHWKTWTHGVLRIQTRIGHCCEVLRCSDWRIWSKILNSNSRFPLTAYPTLFRRWFVWFGPAHCCRLQPFLPAFGFFGWHLRFAHGASTLPLALADPNPAVLATVSTQPHCDCKLQVSPTHCCPANVR